ncbi:hypothetical protein [Streptomyces sp. NPDC005181]|uniref:hypothetical protein n=1 Tax=Streptomyces sp. NPDC005181 TaxID=3156869 RepID=UPI0033ADBCBC
MFGRWPASSSPGCPGVLGLLAHSCSRRTGHVLRDEGVALDAGGRFEFDRAGADGDHIFGSHRLVLTTLGPLSGLVAIPGGVAGCGPARRGCYIR